MSNELWTSVDQYLTDQFVGADDVLESVLASSSAAGLPSINVTATQGKFLYLLVQLLGARRVLEIGTLGGYSTIWMARALPAGGKLVTLECEPRHAAVARENIQRAGLEAVVELQVGRAMDALRQFERARSPAFDVVFIDADKVSTCEYFESALQLTHPGSVIVVDNVVRKGAVADAASHDVNVLAMRRFCETYGRDPRVTMTALQTVGGKGYDGFAIARVN